MAKIKLMLGDCLDKMKKIETKHIDLTLTDPPYGTTACKWDSVIPFDLMWKELKRIIKDNGCIVLFGSEPFSSFLRISNIEWFKYDWIWHKNLKTGFLNAKKIPLLNYELISIFYKNKCKYFPIKELRTTIKAGNKKDSTLTDNYGDYTYDFNNQGNYIYPSRLIENIKCVHNSSKNKVKHPTQKPVALLEYLIKTYSNENDTVLDFTMGSGSTGVACKNLNRDFIGIELDPSYFKIAENRINGS